MPFQQQDPFGAIQGIGATGGANPLLGYQGMQGMQGMGQVGAMPGMAGLQGQAGGISPFGQQQDMFNASPEMKEEMQEQQMKMLRIQQLTQEIQQLEAQKQQQLQNNDEQGAATTDVKIQADKKELAQLMGTDGQQQQQQAGTAAPADVVNPNGNAGAMGGGGGGGVPEVGGGGTGGGGATGGGAATGGGGGTAATGGGDTSNLNAPVTDAGGNVDVSGDLEANGAAGIPDKYKDNQVAQLIWQESKKAGADPYAMLATAVVESGLNPKAVGDNGTSFGLYQYHEGGALGNRSSDWAFNPKNIIQDEAKRFASAGVKDGAGAAAVQRPADAAGYATKVNNVIADMKKK